LPAEARRDFAREWGKHGPEAAVASTHALDGTAELVNADGPLMATAADDSVQVAVKPYRDSLIYELKVPLARIGDIASGQEIGIGIEMGSATRTVRKSAVQTDPKEGRETRDGHKGARAGAGQKLHGAVLHSEFDFDVCLKQATPGTARGPVDIDG